MVVSSNIVETGMLGGCVLDSCFSKVSPINLFLLFLGSPFLLQEPLFLTVYELSCVCLGVMFHCPITLQDSFPISCVNFTELLCPSWETMRKTIRIVEELSGLKGLCLHPHCKVDEFQLELELT